MKALLTLILGLAALMPAKAKSLYEVTPSDRRLLADVLAAVERNDAAWITAHTLLPVAVTVNGERRIVEKKEEFASIITRALTEKLRARIRAEGKKAPFKSWRGVMVGDGILWMEEVRRADDAPWEYVILAFGGFAFQLEESVKPTR